jgi:hypothetical protein
MSHRALTRGPVGLLVRSPVASVAAAAAAAAAAAVEGAKEEGSSVFWQLCALNMRVVSGFRQEQEQEGGAF